MSKLTLNRALMVVAMSAAIHSAYAAPQTIAVSGALASWKAFNAASKAPMLYTNALAGVDLWEGNTSGQNKITGYGQPFINIPVTGLVTYEDTTGVITALSVTQVGSETGYYDVNTDGITDDSYANGGAGGSVTLSNLSWTLNIPQSYMSQVAGTAVGCEADFAACAFTVSATNANDHSNGLQSSPFDFQGINTGFQTLPKSNASLTTYGSTPKAWVTTPGAAPSLVNPTTGAITIAVASRTNSGSPTTNAGNTAVFALIADLPQLRCLPGQYYDGASCLSADPGFFATGRGALSQTACSLGNYQPNSGQSSCLPAAIGFYVDATQAVAQTACPGGQITENVGATSIAACFTPSACSAGSYDNGSSCALADPGYFVPNNGAIAQIPCDAGSYQSQSGSTSCAVAQAGYFVANQASLAQTACSPGSYQPNTGALACITADATFYVPTSAATAQIACQAGYTSSAGASICTLPPKTGDADGDSVSDIDEALIGSNPNIVDTDEDGILDLSDPFPINPALPTATASTFYSKTQLSIPSCQTGKRRTGAQLAFLNKDFNLQLGASGNPVTILFGKYKTLTKGKEYQLNLTANAKTVLERNVDRWADSVCNKNVKVKLKISSFVMTVNKSQTQATLTLNAKAATTLSKGKVKNGTYTFSANLPLTAGAPK
jgi:hypothetical protein